MRTVAVLILALVCALAFGCASNRRAAIKPAVDPAVDQPLPDVAEVVADFNRRVEPLDRLWARIVVQAITETEGGTRRDQGEGHLQIVRPDRVALSLGKLGDTNLYLGSNERRYWWFEMIDEPIAVFGAHENAGEAQLSYLGLPVSPLELVELLAITPIAEDSGPVLAWTSDGLLELAHASRFGVRVIGFEPVAGGYRPATVRLQDPAGRVLGSAELESDQAVRVEGIAPGIARVPVRYLVAVPQRGATIRIRLDAPENRRISDLVFDDERLLRRFRISDVTDLDQLLAGESR